MALYILLRGTHNGFDAKTNTRKLFQAGQAVELSDEQAKAFGDKFKLASAVKAEAAVAKAAEEAAVAAATAAEEEDAAEQAEAKKKADAEAATAAKAAGNKTGDKAGEKAGDKTAGTKAA